MRNYRQVKKGKLFPTSLGSEVNEFLTTNYKLIDSYPYTKKINEKLDKIATGTQTWTDVIDKVYHPLIRKTNNLKKNTPAVNTKGKEIKSIKDESYGVTKDKWGFVLTRLSDNEQRRIKFKKDLTEEKIIEVFMFPIVVGTYKSETIKIKKGPYGMYATINKTNISVKSKDITLKEIIQLYDDKKNNVIHEWKDVKVLNGPYGPYIKKGKINRSIPKKIDPKTLTLEECMMILNEPKKKRKYIKK